MRLWYFLIGNFYGTYAWYFEVKSIGSLKWPYHLVQMGCAKSTVKLTSIYDITQSFELFGEHYCIAHVKCLLLLFFTLGV